MEPEELTLWQERLLVARWGERILRECIQRGVPATAYYQEYGEHFKTGAMRPSSEFPAPVHFAFPDTSERRSPGVGY
jgi:hypothetical protein